MSAPKLRSVAFRLEREASWTTLHRLVERAERGGLASLSAREVASLPGLYRLATSSLSVARAISLDQNVVEYLDALTVRAYGCLYASRRPFLLALSDLFWRGVPRTVRTCAGSVLLSLACLLLGLVVGWVTTDADPSRFYAYVPSGLAGERGPHASTETLRDGLYDRSGDVGSLSAFATYLFVHNTTIGVLCFVLGVVVGLPTVLLLFSNGLMLGGFASLYASRGLGFDLWAWILPHGVPELTAIVLCGAAGLSLARGLLFPGTTTRRESLVARGRDAALLVVGAVLLLAVAGFVEGVLRQTIVHPVARAVLALGMGVAVAGWLAGARSAGSPAP